jgi:hypothetical protein
VIDASFARFYVYQQQVTQAMQGLVSRGCQTDVFVASENADKCFFRIVFEGRTLQYKLPINCALAVMFSKVPVVGGFEWHGIALDSSLTPMHYNMLPGEENCATIHVVMKNYRSTTYSDDLIIRDAVRATSFRLRMQEEESDSLRVQCDELRAQIFALQRELSNVVESNAQRLEDERVKREEVHEKHLNLQAAFRRLETEHEMLRRRSSVRDAMQNIHTRASDERHRIPTVRIHCVLVESDQGKELPFMEVHEPATVSKALEQLMSTQSMILPTLDHAMVCVRSARTGEFQTIDLTDSSSEMELFSGDSLYIAKVD